VVFTRQRAFCSLARVTVTLRLLWPCMVGDGVYCARSAREVQPVSARVLHALPFLVKSILSSLLAAYFGCFPALCLCIFLYLCHNLPFGSYFKLGFFIALWVEIIYLWFTAIAFGRCSCIWCSYSLYCLFDRVIHLGIIYKK
jgi:hypothetical protein